MKINISGRNRFKRKIKCSSIINKIVHIFIRNLKFIYCKVLNRTVVLKVTINWFLFCSVPLDFILVYVILVSLWVHGIRHRVWFYWGNLFYAPFHPEHSLIFLWEVLLLSSSSYKWRRGLTYFFLLKKPYLSIYEFEVQHNCEGNLSINLLIFIMPLTILFTSLILSRIFQVVWYDIFFLSNFKKLDAFFFLWFSFNVSCSESKNWLLGSYNKSYGWKPCQE